MMKGMTTKLPIQSGIPIATAMPIRPRKYPFAEMAVGDSFLVPQDPLVNRFVMRNRVRASARKWHLRTGFVFSVRLSPTEGGYRVWRTE